MKELYQSFSSELKYYLLMNVLFSFACGLSAIFLSVFLWKLNETYTLLAAYSLTRSIAIIFSFGLCAWLARKTSPMFTMRLGFLCFVLEFAIILYLHESLAEHILLLGLVNGLAMSLYYVGEHLAVLDLVPNEVRDKYFYVQNIFFTVGGIIAPIISGVIISNRTGMSGYYVVFALTCVFLFLAFLSSLKIRDISVSKKSYFWDVIKNPSYEWKKMYKVMICDGIVSGAYGTFLITIMIFEITGGELNLSIYQAGIQIFTIFALLWLAKYTDHNNRIKIYGIGAMILFLASSFVGLHAELIPLLIFGMLSTIAFKMLSTSMNGMIYEAIERDKDYEERRLDYIIIREIPLGIGRVIGVLLFLVIREFFEMDKILTVSFIVFPFMYVVITPMVSSIWNKKSNSKA